MSDLDTTLNLGVGGNVVKGINIGGKVLPVSAIRLADNSDIAVGNPFPVSLVSLPAFAATPTVNAAQSGPWSVGVTGSVGVTNTNLDAALSTLGTDAHLTETHVLAGAVKVERVSLFDATGAQIVTLPISAATLPLPSGAATSVLQGGGLPAALVGGRLSVDVGVSALPSGAATAAKQDAQTTLLGGGLPAGLGAGGGLKVDGSGTALPVSVASLPLPSGAATSGKQDTLDGHITDGSLRGTVALSAGVAAIGTVAVSNAFALDATLTSGSQKSIVRGGAKGATSAADVTSTSIDADHNALDVSVKGTAAVSGTVALSAGSAVIGHVITDSGSTTAVTGNVAVTNAGLTNIDVAVSTLAKESGGHLATVDTSTALLATAVSGGKVLTTETSASAIATNTGRIPAQGQALAASSLPVVLTAIQIAQLAQTGQLPAGLGRAAATSSLTVALSNEDAAKVPALGQALAAASTPVVLTVAQDVVAYAPAKESGGNLATIAGAVSASKVQVSDGGGSLTVDAPVGTPVFVELSDGAAAVGTSGNPLRVNPTGTTAQPVTDNGGSLTVDGTVAVSNAFALDATLTGGTQIAIAKGAAAVSAAVSGNPVYVGGKDASGNVQPLPLGATAIAASVAVTPATSSIWAPAGINGSSIATSSNGVPVELVDGSGNVLAFSSTNHVLRAVLDHTYSVAGTTTSFTSLAVAGQVLKAAPGLVTWFELTNGTGGAVFIQFHNRTTTGPANGSVPLYYGASLASGSTTILTVANALYCLPCDTGILVILSSTQATLTAIASTAATGSVVWL